MTERQRLSNRRANETFAFTVEVNTIHRSVMRDGVEIFLSPQQFQIFSIVHRARFGVTPRQLFDVLYADDPNGGPVTGTKAVQVQRVNLNKKLAPLGLRIAGAGSGFRDTPYVLAISGRPI